MAPSCQRARGGFKRAWQLHAQDGGISLGANLQITAMLASTALKAFEPKVPGGRSVPDIWSDRDDFSKRMRSFSEKTAQAAKNAPSMAPEAALASMLDVLDCKSCHQVYRDETK
jgi:cytochrome c556